MTYRMLFATVTLCLLATPTFAQSIPDQLISQLTAEGYQRIEVKNGPSQIKVEAYRDGQVLEVIYDAITGDVLKQESGAVRDGENTAPGIQVRNERHDFIRARNNDDDDPGLGGNGNRFRDDRDHDDDEAEDDDDNDDHRGRGRGHGNGRGNGRGGDKSGRG